MRKFLKMALGVVVFLIALVILIFSYYVYQLSPTSKNSDMIEIEIPKGSNGNNVANILKENNLIRDIMMFKVYLKIHNVSKINYGMYELNEAMGAKQIVDIISRGKTANVDIKITFKEGWNMRKIAKAIADDTNNSEADVLNLLNDDKYIDGLIDEYWFLDDVIKDKDIYYPLEGYLAPNTYNFVDKDVKVEVIFKKMLDQTDIILKPHKEKIENLDFTAHEFLTLASIIQSEGLKVDDMGKIASVFYNRLEEKMKFQSCVTACYATKTEPCVSNQVDTDFVSRYNTYLSNMAGKLPIGPVSNPGEDAIEATANPTDTNYLYFISDKHKNTYFFNKYEDQQAKKAQLIEDGDWLAN